MPLSRIAEKILRDGPVGFAEFMGAALYAPDDGYYADPERRIGRSGDFFTSVSVGPAFGAILARWALGLWEALDRPAPWRLAEPGAHDGTLARDIGAELARLSPEAARSLVYTVPEPLPARCRILSDGFAANPLPGGIRAEVADPAEAPPPPLPGVVVANEVLDALPCHLVEFDGARWLERAVDFDAKAGRFVSRLRPVADPALAEAAQHLGAAFPAGYQTEIRTGFAGFLRPLRDLLSRGRLLFLDYGFAAPEFYDPARTEGTLRTFRDHRAGDDPLATPGEADITAHVDFTAAARAALGLGMEPVRFSPQGNFLTESGRGWLEALANLPEDRRFHAVRQFQTLTHPAHLGMKFHALELAWNFPADDPATAARARRHLVLDAG